MKQYILKLSLAILCLVGVSAVNAQEQSDSDTTKTAEIELPFGKVSENRLVGAVDVITKEDIMHSSLPNVYSAIQGLAPGYVNGRIRGKARGGINDTPLIIVDGLSNRALGSLTLEEIESVQILKDVTAKMLYGSRAANGVIVVKTKRGYNGDTRISVTGEYGYQMAAGYPEYLGSADYMTYNNQAMLNDGKSPVYSQEQIDNAGIDYKNSDVNYHDMFVEDHKSYKKANIDLIGGEEKLKYFLNLGWMGEDGIEKVGDKRTTNRINVRSNLDYKVNDIVSVNLDIAGQFYNSAGSPVSNVFSEMNKRKPNDYPIFISDEAHIDSMGTSDIVDGGNLYGDMVYSGYRRTETALANTNMGMDFDLNQFVEGLTAGVDLRFDINNSITEGKDLTYRTLKPGVVVDAVTGEERDTLEVYGVYNPKGSEKKFSDGYYRNVGFTGNVDYNRVFGDHAVMANFSYLMDNKSVKTIVSNDDMDANELMATIQDDKTMNYGLRLNYAFQDKYVVEYTGSYMGSTRFNKDNRWKLYNAVGASYIVSEEDFMADVDAIDFLKVKASYGTIGYDQSFDYLLYNDYYKYWAASYKVGAKEANKSIVGTQYQQAGNPDLTYEESTEFNVGLTMRMLDNKLQFNADYFTEERTGMPIEMEYAYPKVVGVPTIVANYNAVSTNGYELALQYGDNAGDFAYSFGGSLSYSKSVWSQYDELNDFSFQNREGTEVDAIWGYETDGFYTTADEVANYGMDGTTPLTSALGTFIPGDLKIKDLSDNYEEYSLNDNVINSYDRTIIGNSTPRYAYSLNLSLSYKNFSFYALGQGFAGSSIMSNGMTYITNKGNVKYSKFAENAAVPVFDADGNATGLESTDYTLPRLTTNGSSHSYNASTFWKNNAAYFRLRTVELNYEMPKSVVSRISAHSLNVFVRANNLLTVAAMKDVSPASPWAGITTDPEFITLSGGLRLSF